MLVAFILTLTLLPAWFGVFGLPAAWQPGSRPLHFGLDRLRPWRIKTLGVLRRSGTG